MTTRNEELELAYREGRQAGLESAEEEVKILRYRLATLREQVAKVVETMPHTAALVLGEPPRSEWIEFGRTFMELKEERLGGSAVGHLVTVHGEDYLVGDVDDNGGDTGYLPAFDGGSIVTRYRRVWDGES